MKPVKNNINNYKEQKDKSLTFLTLSILALFVGGFVSITLYSVTLINLYTISKLWIGFTFVGFLIPLKYYQKWFNFIKYEMIIFNVIGIGPFLMALFLSLNYILSTETLSQKYRIEKIYYEGENNAKYLGIILEGKEFSGERKITEIDPFEASKIVRKPYLKLVIANGVFGYQVITERTFIK